MDEAPGTRIVPEPHFSSDLEPPADTLRIKPQGRGLVGKHPHSLGFFQQKGRKMTHLESRRLPGMGLIGSALVLLLAMSLLFAGGCTATTQASAEDGDGASEKAASTSKSDSSEDGDEEENEEEAVPVQVTQLSTGRMEQVLLYSANLEAENHVQVYAQAARLVRELLVEEGDTVEKGDVLLRLLDEEQRNNLAKARSQLDKSDREFQRLERLFDEELISEQKISDATYDLEQLRIAVSDAERELGYTQVKAPISGTVTSRLVKLGDQVSVNQHLFDIVDFDSMVALVYVPEKNLAQLAPGQVARVSSQALGERIYPGSIDRIAPVVDPKTGTLKVTVAVGRQAGLLPGLYVDVALVTAVHDQALLMPKRALVYDKDRVFVFRLSEERRVERLTLDPTLADRDNVKVEAPLQAGDQIVVAGQAGLKDGTLVSLPGDKEKLEEDPDALPDSQATAQVASADGTPS
jgi:membrane fusion protein (multidrug efflux system)